MQNLGPLSERTMSLLNTTLYFEGLSWEWWWIADYLYEFCIKIAQNIDNDNCKTLAIIQFLYARFLLYKS